MPAVEDEPAPSVAPAVCWLVFGESRLPLARGEHLIGRSPKSVVPIDDMTISRHHARIDVGDEVTLVDLGSRNGTYVRGEKVSAPSTLHHGDRVAVGKILMTVLMPQPGASTTEQTTQAPNPER
jgi:pSer/pThr/pTyr-binding forkhead associated (FHA) protein